MLHHGMLDGRMQPGMQDVLQSGMREVCDLCDVRKGSNQVVLSRSCTEDEAGGVSSSGRVCEGISLPQQNRRCWLSQETDSDHMHGNANATCQRQVRLKAACCSHIFKQAGT